MGRLDFMNCPLCSGHEQMSEDAAHTLREAIDLYLVPATDLPEHVRGELLNIRNVIQNGREPGRPEPATQEESWLDA